MKIVIETIDHKDQRYPTVGDWYAKDGVLYIKVSDLGNLAYKQLIAVHELVEMILCQNAGVKQEEVDAFDMAYESEREMRLEKAPLEDRKSIEAEEPGDDGTAPYRRQHCFATAVERMLAAEMNVSWNDYDAAIYALP